MGAAGGAVGAQGRKGGSAEVVRHRADLALRAGQHVARTGDVERRDRHAGGQRFEQHQAEGVGAAREHEHVAAGIRRRQLGVRERSGKHHVRMARPELREKRAAAHHHPESGQVEVEERLDGLFHSDPSDIQEHRPGQPVLRCPIAARLRGEALEVDAARPRHEVAEAAPGQLAPQAVRRHQCSRRRVVEPAHHPVGQPERQTGAGVEVFGKAGVERGGEAEAAAQGPAPCCGAERPFGGDMQPVRPEPGDDPRQPSSRQQGQPDLRIGRAGQGAEPVWSHHLDRVPHRPQLGRDGGQGADHAVHLRRPGIRHDQDPSCAGFRRRHAVTGRGAARAAALGARAPRNDRPRRCTQSTSSSLPSACSTRAVQLSTQSPSLR